MRYPFTPEWLDAAPEPIAERFRALEDTVIQEIARQLTQGGELNESSIQRIRVLRGLGLDMDAIEKAVAETAGTTMLAAMTASLSPENPISSMECAKCPVKF